MDTIATGTGTDAYREVVREQGAWTTRLEKRVLARLARAMPDGVGPDHLTALGFAGMLLTGVAYALSGRNPLFLHAANFGLLVNWFGDSLDGTLARHRGRLRPRYGFYVDHVVDAFGATAVLGGLAASHLMAPVVAACVLVAYLLFSVHLYLQTHRARPLPHVRRGRGRDRAAHGTRGDEHGGTRVAGARGRRHDRAPARRGRYGRRRGARDRSRRVGRLDHERAVPPRAGLIPGQPP